MYTEKVETEVTIKSDGVKLIRTITITLKDGVEVGRANHRSSVAADAEVPPNVAAHIERLKGRQPPQAK
jgi:hypothetical protein